MDRREFLAATAVAAAHPLARVRAVGQQQSARQYIELRRYHLLPGTKQRAFSAFVGDAAIPAMNRAGIDKVGAFTIVYGENAPSLLLVLAHLSRHDRPVARGMDDLMVDPVLRQHHEPLGEVDHHW